MLPSSYKHTSSFRERLRKGFRKSFPNDAPSDEDIDDTAILSENLCSRCLKLQEYVNGKGLVHDPLTISDYVPLHFYSDPFRPASLSRDDCGVCHVIFKAVEKVGSDSLDQLWRIETTINLHDSKRSPITLRLFDPASPSGQNVRTNHDHELGYQMFTSSGQYSLPTDETTDVDFVFRSPLPMVNIPQARKVLGSSVQVWQPFND